MDDNIFFIFADIRYDVIYVTDVIAERKSLYLYNQLYSFQLSKDRYTLSERVVI